MSHPRIKWSHRGMVVIDVPKEILQSALASVGSEHPASLGSEIESLYVELRGLGVPVVVEIDPRRSLKHGCGKAYSTAQWEALPSFNQPAPLFHNRINKTVNNFQGRIVVYMLT